MSDEQTGNTHEEAAEILTDLMANQSLSANNNGGTTQVGEAQKAALQQLVSGNNVLNERSVKALLDAMSGNGGEGGEKKHVFWDTQVSFEDVVEFVCLCFVVAIEITKAG